MPEVFLYLFTGAAAGTLAGLLGLGGGIIVVPMLCFLFREHFPSELIMHLAVGTSFAVMFFTALSSAFAYHRRDLILWPLFYKFIPGLLFGTLVGAVVARSLSSQGLQIFFSLFLMVIACKMFFSKDLRPTQNLPSQTKLSVAGFLIGNVSGFFGIGGGSMMLPFFKHCKIDMRKAAGTTALCGFPLAFIGALSLMVTGWKTTQGISTAGTLGYVYWPAALLISTTSLLCAPLGTRLAVWLPEKTLKRIFSLVLVVTAFNLLRGALA